MRRGVAVIGGILGAFLSCMATAATPDTTRLEHDVLVALNAARSDPAAYSGSLKAYRRYFKARMVVMPGRRVDYVTAEGVAPVDDAIVHLAGQAAMDMLASSPVLAAAAADHVREQSRSGRTGHYGSDGSAPADRVVQRGGGTMVAEVIAYGAVDAADVIRQLIVDDGVPDRGHRIMLYAQHLRYAGVACGPHPEFRTMCVIDLADTPDGQPAGRLRPIQVAARDRIRR